MRRVLTDLISYIVGLYDYTKSMRTPSVSPTRRYHQNTSTDCFDTPPPPTLSYSPTPSLNSHSPTTPTNFESISRSRYGAVTRQNNYLTSPVPGPIQISTTLAADVQFDPVVGSPSTLSRHSSQGSGADQGNKMMMASFPHKITVSRNDIATRYVLVGNIPSSATRVELEHIFAVRFPVLFEFPFSYYGIRTDFQIMLVNCSATLRCEWYF